MKKTIKNIDIKNKKVIIRCDFNVPMKDGKITNDYRIKRSIPTIEYAIKKGSKIILMSHLGRIKTVEDKKLNTLKPVAKRLEELLNHKVKFISSNKGVRVERAINEMQKGDIILLENTRFTDLTKQKESENNPSLGKYWASLADVFINDAFGLAHRTHASNVGIASHLPNAIGLLMESEVKYLSKKPKKPYIVILGGSKVSDKIGIIDKLAKKADYVLIGGAMAFTFLKATGFSVGRSLVENDYLDYCIKVLNKYENKIVLPIDVITSLEISDKAKPIQRFINEIDIDEIGLDIGPQTIKVFSHYLKDAKTIFWNGPIGYFEIENFSEGTRKLLEVITRTKATTIIGGGDSVSAAINMGYADKITHISTGGGASLKFLEGKELPGLDVIDEK